MIVVFRYSFYVFLAWLKIAAGGRYTQVASGESFPLNITNAMDYAENIYAAMARSLFPK